MSHANVQLPSLEALLAFESAARHECFTRAAAELNVTQGAISRQIRVLEDRLGVSLFQRVRRRVVLAEAGRAYLPDVRRLLNQLESATVRVMTAAERSNVLALAVAPGVGSRWLIPRLPDFLRKHPDLWVSCSIRQVPVDFGAEPFDAAIDLGLPTRPDAATYHLIDECLVPVCTPAFQSAHRIHRVEDLARVPLLQVASQPAAWATWFLQRRASAPDVRQGLTFDDFTMLTAGASAGLGVALLPTFFVAEEIADRKLVAVARPQPSTLAYRLVVPAAKAASPHVRAFVRWIEEAKPTPLPAVRRGNPHERERVGRLAS